MTDKEFVKEIYELAYGDSAFDKGFITGHEEVIAQIEYYVKATSLIEETLEILNGFNRRR